SFNVMQKIGMNYGGRALYDDKKECEICVINNYVVETEEFILRPFQEQDSGLLYDLWKNNRRRAIVLLYLLPHAMPLNS
ncbi:hypothetical protein, partial [uncultured Amphritea sp.]|uniref:hypothetical protein n=1 Tax=uncultured Amphritea sp. TaxID=981605 RepID=UPI00260DF3B4